MEWLFGRKMTPDEMLRKNQRALNKAMRELDREKAKMEQQEKKIIQEIKKNAKQGQMDAVKVMAKVRTKLQSQFFISKKSKRFEVFSLKIRILQTHGISLKYPSAKWKGPEE